MLFRLRLAQNGLSPESVAHLVCSVPLDSTVKSLQRYVDAQFVMMDAGTAEMSPELLSVIDKLVRDGQKVG